MEFLFKHCKKKLNLQHEDSATALNKLYKQFYKEATMLYYSAMCNRDFEAYWANVDEASALSGTRKFLALAKEFKKQYLLVVPVKARRLPSGKSKSKTD